MRRALLSVSDKTGLVDFARALAARGFELVSTGGTATVLQRAGLSVIGISEVTGFPEMMDGRVKTLHPLVHGGILARRARPDDLASAATHGITLIDLVVVNLYPFVKAASNPDTPFDGLVEEIDIGGPSLVRAAAKNFHDVLVVVSPSDYDGVLAQLDRTGGPSREFRFDLARKAFAHTGAYDTAIASTLATVVADETGFRRESRVLLDPADRPAQTINLALRKLRDLRYGENPHQKAAWYAEDPAAGLGNAQVLQGKELSYTNLLDLDAAARIVLEFDEPAAAVIKHTNPCGAATGNSAADAYLRARDADALAAFGGIIGLNRPIDEATAKAITSTFIEAVVAPAVDDEARAILATKANLRVVTADFTSLAQDTGRELRSILGAVLLQSRDRVSEASRPWPSGDLKVVTTRQPTAAEWQALRFAWRICAHVKSNTIIFTSADRTLAIGAGQMSRVDAAKVARMKADAAGPDTLKGSVAASDAFFPFRDGLDVVAEAGATAVVQPGGSVRDQEVIAAADERGLAMVFTGRRHFRH
ncbi:MAG: bifunctional phosphoribosylaminoimidazolecarboxamide formyltransferase/inosine monophosphate cyclohydrolase [Acidobacteria bacterium]|nr:MAG: bifunctional phosphoribosylaminoimidazolecarboxamide formyltransferase/inosine monophosphate cyclohydrolase [Acidobacteriota bacterium]